MSRRRPPDAPLPSGEAGPAEAEPHYLGHRDRLRARFAQGGADALPDYELLELALFRAIPRRDVKPLAKALIRRFGSFAEVISAEPARLAEIEGIGRLRNTIAAPRPLSPARAVGRLGLPLDK